jgi:hypothetical protein
MLHASFTNNDFSLEEDTKDNTIHTEHEVQNLHTSFGESDFNLEEEPRVGVLQNSFNDNDFSLEEDTSTGDTAINHTFGNEDFNLEEEPSASELQNILTDGDLSLEQDTSSGNAAINVTFGKNNFDLEEDTEGEVTNMRAENQFVTFSSPWSGWGGFSDDDFSLEEELRSKAADVGMENTRVTFTDADIDLEEKTGVNELCTIFNGIEFALEETISSSSMDPGTPNAGIDANCTENTDSDSYSEGTTGSRHFLNAALPSAGVTRVRLLLLGKQKPVLPRASLSSIPSEPEPEGTNIVAGGVSLDSMNQTDYVSPPIIRSISTVMDFPGLSKPS